ncbi:ribonuclease R [Candidatus Latescibacterota bacterium]
MKDDNIQSLILDAIKSSGKKRIKRRQLYTSIGNKKLDYEEFKKLLTEMEKSGLIVRMKGRRYAIPDESGILSGVFTLARNGGGHIRISNGDTVYVNPRFAGGAMTGDTVQAKILKNKRQGISRNAKVINILERTTRPVIGIFKTTGKTSYVISRDKSFAGNLLVKKGSDPDARDGELVVARVEMPSTGISHPMCVITEVLGDPDTPGVDVLAIAKQYQLSVQFPDEVIAESEMIQADLTPEVIGARKDIRDLVTFTIDPVDAKDFDDAISIEKTGDGYFHIGVHIADVSHYVKRDSALDREALARGTSCYLVDRVIPMLPEKLSNDLCSLKPDKDRLTKSVFAVVTPEGKIIDSEIANTVIHSRMRLTYQQVQAYLDAKEGKSPDFEGFNAGEITPEVGEALIYLSELTDILLKQREKRGSLDFENPEALLVLDEEGKPINIVRRDRYKAHRMVEEAMLLANTITAKALASGGVLFLYRIHEKPDPLKLETFADVADTLGYYFNYKRANNQLYIQNFLYSLRGNVNERILNMFLLRSMKRACYSPENRGHYGLALPVYTHFTSPIRRYPDLIVHRKLDASKTRKTASSEHHDMSYYKVLGEILTQREVISDSAERDSIKMKTAEFMKKHLGEEFNGTVSGIVPAGFFVELDKYFAEGFVHVSTLYNDYFKIDRSGVALIGKSSGQKFMLGDRVRVIVASANKEQRKVDFELVKKLKDR